MAGLTSSAPRCENEHGYIVASAPQGLTGGTVWLDFPSVGATENVLMAAVLARARPSSTTRRASRRSSTCARCCSRWARRSTGWGPRRSTIEGVDRLYADHARDRAGPDRRGHLGVRRRDDPGRRDRPQRPAPSTSRSRWTSWAAPGATCTARRRVPGRDGAAADARSTPSRCPTRASHRPAAAGDRARTPSRTAPPWSPRTSSRRRFVFAQRAGPARRGRAHRRPPRHGPRGAAAVRCAGRASDIRAGAALVARRAGGRGRDTRERASTTSTAATRLRRGAAPPRRRRHPRARPGRGLRPS